MWLGRQEDEGAGQRPAQRCWHCQVTDLDIEAVVWSRWFARDVYGWLLCPRYARFLNPQGGQGKPHTSFARPVVSWLRG